MNITEIAKLTIGRLRPHFLTVCGIELTEELCKENGYLRFVENYECQENGPYHNHTLVDARKSFLSGMINFLKKSDFGRLKNA